MRLVEGCFDLGQRARRNEAAKEGLSSGLTLSLLGTVRFANSLRRVMMADVPTVGTSFHLFSMKGSRSSSSGGCRLASFTSSMKVNPPCLASCSCFQPLTKCQYR